MGEGPGACETASVGTAEAGSPRGGAMPVESLGRDWALGLTPAIPEAKAGGLWVQGKPRIQNKFQASLNDI